MLTWLYTTEPVQDLSMDQDTTQQNAMDLIHIEVW